MKNFDYQNQTRIVFGKDTARRTGELIRQYGNRVLLHYGGGSIKKNGLYNQIKASLHEADMEIVELGGVQPNPRADLVREGITLCRREKVDCILAVGGGSVIDSAKAIGFGSDYRDDVWDFFSGKASIKSTLPVATVLTIPAAGSEDSVSCVISDGEEKVGVGSPLIRPVFSILDPEITYTLPPYQTACGGADIMAHIMERYFVDEEHVDLTDRLCEATLTTVITHIPRALYEPHDYAARAEIMWAGTIAHNGLLDTGRGGDWTSHLIEHQISALYDIAHGAGLSIVLPAWMKFVARRHPAKFAQFAHRVWKVDADFQDPFATALEGIHRLEAYFRDTGLPVRLSGAGIKGDRIKEMVEKYAAAGPRGDIMTIESKDVEEILNLAL